MEVTINLPDEMLEPVKRSCKGFKISLERALEIICADWVAQIDAEFYLFESPCTPAYRAFDWQFTDRLPEGETIESSYESSRVNWINHLAGNFEFYYKEAEELKKQDDLIKTYQDKDKT